MQLLKDGRSWPDRMIEICASIEAVLFLSSGLIYMSLARWTVIQVDFWRLYEIYLNHPWPQSALFKVNNHSLFFPSLFWMADLQFFRGRQLPLFLAGLSLLALTMALLLIPVWKDRNSGRVTKMICTLVLVVGNFWMARAQIIVSGASNCSFSLLTAAAALAFLALPHMRTDSAYRSGAMLVVLSGGFVASFSFATGLALWPSLILLAFCLRVPFRSIAVLAGAGLLAIIIFVLLPEWGSEASWLSELPTLSAFSIKDLFRLVGSPVSYALFAWWPGQTFRRLLRSSNLPVIAGGIGFAFAVFAAVRESLRRDLQKIGVRYIGLALTVLSGLALLVIAIGRADYFHAAERPHEVLAPRYLFWSTLFWTGLLLIAIQRLERSWWARYPAYALALALPIAVFPEHWRESLARRQGVSLAEAGATSLINGVRDEQQTRVLFYNHPDIVYRLTPQLRQQRLGMFADGFQDWVGRNQSTLFGGRRKAEGLRGRCKVATLVRGDESGSVARVAGWALKRGGAVPRTLVIVDLAGVIRGIARCTPTNTFINRTLYLGKLKPNTFLGYVRDYNPHIKYVILSADDSAVSNEKIPVPVPPEAHSAVSSKND